MTKPEATKDEVCCHVSSFFHHGVKDFINDEVKSKLQSIIDDAMHKFKITVKNTNITESYFQMEFYPENNENISVIIGYIKQRFTQWLNGCFNIKGTAWM